MGHSRPPFPHWFNSRWPHLNRWPLMPAVWREDYILFKIFGHLHQWKFCPMALNFCQGWFKILPNAKLSLQKLPKWQNSARSCQIGCQKLLIVKGDKFQFLALNYLKWICFSIIYPFQVLKEASEQQPMWTTPTNVYKSCPKIISLEKW